MAEVKLAGWTADAERIERDIEFFGDAARDSGVFGPAVGPPEGADRQTRLLAKLGRRAGAA